MSALPPTPQSTVAAPSIDPRVEQVEAWWRDNYTLVVRDCHGFRSRLPELRRAVDECARNDPPDLALVRANMLVLGEGIAHWASSENDAAERVLRSAIESLETWLPRVTTSGLVPMVHRLLGNSQVYLGHVAHNRGDFAGALRAYLRVREIAVAGGFAVMHYHALAGVSMIYGETAMWETQLAWSREAREVGQIIQNEVAVAQLDMMAAHAYRKLRDFTAAREVVERALEVFRRHGWKGEELDALLRLAMMDLDEQKPAAAIERLRNVEALSATVNRPHFEAARRIELARAHLGLGDLPVAADVVRGVLERFVDVMGCPDHADARLLLARIHVAGGDFASAATAASAALRLLTQTGMPHELEAEAHAILAEAARGRGDWPTACTEERARHEAYVRHFHHQADQRSRVIAVQHQIDIARATAERERVERQRLEELLADLAVRLEAADAQPRARSPEDISPADLRPLGLTPRESEVLLWVARGKTNEEIAIILGCGAETVKSHLKRIYQQLDVTNRAAAAALVMQPRRAERGITAVTPKPAGPSPEQGRR